MATESELLTVTVEKDMSRACEEGDLKAVYAKLDEKLNEYRNIPLSLAITGQTGAGKSTLCNAFRDLKEGDPGSAAIGVTGTTVERKAFPDSNNPNLVYWDLPGVDSPDFPREAYLKDIRFHEYDFFIILMKDRFKGSDLWLAREVRKQGKKFFFVRTSIHQSIENQKKGSRNAKSDEEYLEQMKKEIKDNLGDLYQENWVFLMDSLEPHKYDFDRLKVRLVQELPKLKRDALTLSLSVTGEKMIQLKVAAIRESFLGASVGSGLIALIPIPLLSTCRFVGVVTKMAVWMNLSEWEAAKAFVVTAAKEVGLVAGTVTAMEGARWAPVVGSVVSGVLTSLNTKSLLEAILEKLVEKAKHKFQDKIKQGIH